MSELTICNYCKLKLLKLKYKADGKKVTLKPAKREDKYFLGGVDIFVDGEKVGWMMKIPSSCEC
jgi:hypothetical protein